MLKLKMMLCVMMLPLVVVGCTSKQSVDQCIEATASGVDNTLLPPTCLNTAERDYFTRREADHYAKNNWKELEIILMSSANEVAHIDGQLMPVIIVSNTRASGINA